jgi:hypothetical protein
LGCSFRQRLSFRFRSERDDEKTEQECNGRTSDWDPQRCHPEYCRTNQEIDARADESADRRTECECGGANSRFELFGQPKAEE